MRSNVQPPSMLCSFLTLFFTISASALTPLPEETKGELTIDLHWKSRHVAQGEFKDLTTIERHTTIVCPVVTSGVQTTSIIVGPTADQIAANAELGNKAKAMIEAVPKETIDEMTALDQQMKACRKAGGSDQSCGMQVMLAMKNDPKILNSLEQINDNDMTNAEEMVNNAEMSIQPWFNEGCSGQMTVNDSRKLDDPTIAGEEPTIHTTGTQKIETRDTLVTVETDLLKDTTQIMFVAPEASGFIQEAGYGEESKSVSAMALPQSVVIVGPLVGPLRNGSHSYKIPDGEVSLSWIFRQR
jgi:hypothetical protein